MESATLVYLRSEGKTLMLHRGASAKADSGMEKKDMHNGKYVAPGGHFKPGEMPIVCAGRELLEESGYTAHDLELIAIILFNNKGRIFADGKTRDDYQVHIFGATKYSGKLKQPKEGTLEWIADEEMINLPMWDADKIFTKWIYQDKKFRAEFRQPAGKCVEFDVDFLNELI